MYMWTDMYMYISYFSYIQKYLTVQFGCKMASLILKEKAFHTFKENKNSLIVKSLKRPKYKD